MDTRTGILAVASTVLAVVMVWWPARTSCCRHSRGDSDMLHGGPAVDHAYLDRGLDRIQHVKDTRRPF